MRLIALAAIAVFALDQASKFFVMEWLDLIGKRTIDVMPPFLNFIMAWNRGVNFGVLTTEADLARWALVVLAIAISALLLVWALRRGGRWLLVGAGMVIGGALANALDRVRYGAVADFLNMSCCGIDNPYVFNLADVAIFAGAGLMILTSGEKRAAGR
ncbi:signal peptidase II [Pikeienuella piscinae]|uniref:Lipoprotein signal peptidase n=1 Tax=Pikeienuella piscinae TaxID=2748098 RepID=A0A7L5C3S9_9RHOB|nr:signal peptidase II [Pikeienuella piscinae]QIE56924.1 signal peptidase II [Pikeienuella piscinae]